MGSRSQVVLPPPPPGFVLQTTLPPPPPGFVLEGQAEPTTLPKPTAPSAFRPLGPVGRAQALAPTAEEAPALEEAGRAFLKAAEQPISATLGGETFSSLVDKTLGEWGKTGGWRGSLTDATRIAAGVADFIQSPAGVAALGATVATVGAAGPYIAAGFGAHAAVQTPQAIRTYLGDPTPENLQQALLTPGFAALMASAAGHGRAPAAPEQVSRVRAPAERPAEAKPAPPVRPLPPAQPVSPREAADLGVSAERVPEVLRRQREAEAVTARAAERQPQRPSPILEELPPPPEGFVLERGIPAVRHPSAAADIRLAIETLGRGEKINQSLRSRVESISGLRLGEIPQGPFVSVEAAQAARLISFVRRSAERLGLTPEQANQFGHRLREKIAPETIRERPTRKAFVLERTYEQVQKEIDAVETKLETPQFTFSASLRDRLNKLYQERDAIGAGELSESLADLQGTLARNGIREKDAEVVLEYYSLRPGKVEAVDQYFAAEYTERFARRPFKQQVEDVGIKLGIRRGEEISDFGDLSARSRTDARKAVKIIRQYFGVERPSPLKQLEAAGRRTAVDEFGDTIERGGRVVDSLGRSGKVTSVGALVQDLETGKAVFRKDTLKVDFGKGPEPVRVGEVTVKRRARPKALEGVGRKPVRHFGESEEAFGARVNREASYDRLFSNPLIPLSEAYTRLVGRPMWEWGERLLWRMTPDFIQRAIRTRPELIKERVPSGEAYVEARREARGFTVEKVERGLELGERLTQKFSAEEQQALGRMVKGEARPEDLAKMRQDAVWNDAIEAAKDARTEFDNLGSQAVMQGLLRDESFFRNYGKYMPRLYRKYELPYEQLAKQFGERKPTRLDLSRFKQRKDIPEHIRMMMGEILEPGLPVAKGIAQIAHDVANMRLFNTVADNPLWAARSLDNLWRQGAKPADFVQMPTTTKLGRLSGSWVNKYIADDLNQIIRARTELNKMSRALVGEWKFSKVILNPATHGRNLMSNMILAHAGGLPMTRLDIYYRALRELASRGEIYREAKTASQGRMGRGTYAAAEFELLLDSWNKTTGGLGDRFAAMSQALREGKPSEAFKQVRISGTRFGRGAARIYQAEEEWFKLSKYIHNKEKGMAPKEAWLDAEKWLFDYSEVPSFIDWSRQSPLGAPFVTFTYKALPVIAESIVTAPWRMGAILGTLYWMNKKAADVLGLGEKQREEIEKVLPPRMRGKVFGVPKFIMLPFRDKYGQVQYLDLTYILPWGDIGEAGGLGRGIVEKIPGVRAVAGLVRQAPGLGAPLVQTLAEIGLNKSSFTGREIYHPWETKEEIAKKINLYLLRQVAPSLVPGGYGFTRLQKAITQEPDYMGRTTSIPSAAASALLGLKITPIDPRLQRIYRRSERERDVRGIEMQIGRVRRNRGLKASEKAEEIRRLRRMQVEIRRKQ